MCDDDNMETDGSSVDVVMSICVSLVLKCNRLCK